VSQNRPFRSSPAQPTGGSWWRFAAHPRNCWRHCRAGSPPTQTDEDFMSDRTLTDPKVIDGKAFAAKLREKNHAPGEGIAGQARLHAGPRGRAGRRGSGQLRSMCATRASRPCIPEWRASRTGWPAHHLAGRTAGPDRQAQQGSEHQRHPLPVAAAQADRSAGHHQRHRSGQGCGWLPRGECRAAGDGWAGAGAVHALWLPVAAEGPARRPRRQACGV